MSTQTNGTRVQRERGYAKTRIALVNEAYRTLRNPSSRAQYLLQQRGVDAIGESVKVVDPVLLAEVFDARCWGGSEALPATED